MDLASSVEHGAPKNIQEAAQGIFVIFLMATDSALTD